MKRSNLDLVQAQRTLKTLLMAVIFAGYQIAFAHKRIGDVAPILIGGVLIGAAGQIARMLLGEGSDGKCGGGTGTTYYLINNAIQYYSA